MHNFVEKFKNRNPFEVAKEKKIIVIEEPLGEIYGYYNRIKRIPMIHLNEDLPEYLKKFTCAHELGHALLHPHEATPKLSRVTMVSNLKIEREANEFATLFLIDGSHENYYIDNKYDLLQFYGIPQEMERFI